MIKDVYRYLWKGQAASDSHDERFAHAREHFAALLPLADVPLGALDPLIDHVAGTPAALVDRLPRSIWQRRTALQRKVMPAPGHEPGTSQAPFTQRYEPRNADNYEEHAHRRLRTTAVCAGGVDRVAQISQIRAARTVWY